MKLRKLICNNIILPLAKKTAPILGHAVVYLTGWCAATNRNYRIKDEECKAILSRLRTGDSNDEDADQLMGLHFSYHNGDDE